MICCLVLLLSLARGNGYVTEKGREFIIAFVENRILVDYPIIKLYATSVSEIPVNVTFSVPLMTDEFADETLELEPGQVAVKEYPYELHMLDDGVDYKGVLVTSTDDITVQAASINDLTSEAFLAYPTHALGKDYFVMSYHFNQEDDPRPDDGQTHTQGPSIFGLVGFWPGTSVYITVPGEATITFYLDQFQTYQLGRDFDITGTHISSDKPLAVFCGSVWTSISKTYMGDHLLEHLLPVNTWGSEFVSVPIATRTAGDVFRVLAHQNETRVRIVAARNNRIYWHTHIINEGEFREFNARSDQPLHIVANKGVEVAQFSKSFEADNVRNSDPFMTILPPTDQFSGNYSFTTPVTFFPEKQDYDHYLAIVIEEEASDGLMLNGQVLTSDNFLSIWRRVGHTNLTAMTLNITTGTHILTHTDLSQTFGAYIYGLKFQEAYGHALGQRVDTIDYVCTRTFVIIRDRFDNDCDGRLDEEIENQLDDDGDGLIDEDLDGELPTTQPWTTGGPTTTQPPPPTTTLDLTTVHQHTSAESVTTETTASPTGYPKDTTFAKHHTLPYNSHDGDSSQNGGVSNGYQISTQPSPGHNGVDLHYVTPTTSYGEWDFTADTNDGDSTTEFSLNNDALNNTNANGQNATNSDSEDGSLNGENGNWSSNGQKNDGSSNGQNNNGSSNGQNNDGSSNGQNNDGSANGTDVNGTTTQLGVNEGADNGKDPNVDNININDSYASTNGDILKDNNSSNNVQGMLTTTTNTFGNGMAHSDPSDDYRGYQGMLFSQGKTTEYDHNRSGSNDNAEATSLTSLSSGGLGELQVTTITKGGRHGNAGEVVASTSSGENVGNSYENSSRNSVSNGEHILDTGRGITINPHATLQTVSDDGKLTSSTKDGANKGTGGGNDGMPGHSWISSTNVPDTSDFVVSTDDDKINSNTDDGNSGGGKDSDGGNGGGNSAGNGSASQHFNGTAGKNNGSTVSNPGSLGYSEWTTNMSDEQENGPNAPTDLISPSTSLQDISTSNDGKDFKSTSKIPAGGSSSSEDDDNGDSWWVYLLVTLGIVLLLIILVIIIKRCKRNSKRKNSIKSESLGTPLLTHNRPNSGSRSITPPIPVAISTPQIVPESPVSPPKLLAPPTTTHPTHSTLGSCFEASHEIYNPSQGIWSSITNSKDHKRKKQERRSSSSSFINLPDVIISVPHSKHVTLKQLHPPNTIYVESST